jgi:hypothetical protein
MEASPTPFDILEIPYFAYVPGAFAWAVFLLSSVILLYGIRGWLNRKPSAPSSLGKAMGELRNLVERTHSRHLDKEAAALASLTVKRYLGAAHQIEVAHLSMNELEAFRRSLTNERLSGLIAQLLVFDNVKYRADGDEVLEVGELESLCSALESFATAAKDDEPARLVNRSSGEQT